MNLRIVVAAIIFIGSYLPLSLILFAQNYDYTYLDSGFCDVAFSAPADCALPMKNPWFSTLIFFACVVCFSAAVLTLRVVNPKQEIDVVESKHVPSELMGYVLPYVVSFMSIDYQEIGKFVGFTIFLIWMFWITLKSGQIILNPVLTAFGWRLYEIKYRFPASTEEFSGLALSKTPILAGGRYKQASIQDVLIVK